MALCGSKRKRQKNAGEISEKEYLLRTRADNKAEEKRNLRRIHQKARNHQENRPHRIQQMARYNKDNRDHMREQKAEMYRNKRSSKMAEQVINTSKKQKKNSIGGNHQRKHSSWYKSGSSNSGDEFYLINEDSTLEEKSNCLFQGNTPEFIDKLVSDLSSKFDSCLSYDAETDTYSALSNICVVCDRLIIGLEPVKWLTKDEIERNRDRLSVESFESHYRIEISDDLRIQYQVTDKDLHGILLSPRAKRHKELKHSYCCCDQCYRSITSPNNEECSNPPKFSIANGFVIGHIPRTNLCYTDGNGISVKFPGGELPGGDSLAFDPDVHLDDLICAAISPVRPYGYVHAYQGGSQKSITGHFSFFSVDQSHVGGVLNKYRSVGNNKIQPSKNIFVVLCGRMTPNQKKIIKQKSEMDTKVFLHLLNWFVRVSGHSGFKDVTPPDECPDMIAFLKDEDTENNTDDAVDDHLECKIEGKTYYFSDDLQRPNTTTSVYDATDQFVKAMLNNTDPTMLMYGGSYLKSHEVHLEDVFPIQFPFGLGGPKPNCPRKVPVSEEACLRHYMRLSLKQFMRPDFILVCYHLMCRSESYTTGLIKCKSDFKGESLASRISKLTVEDIESAASDLSALHALGEMNSSNNAAATFLKSVTTSCKVLGHTTEAAKEARRKMYALTERFGPHSLFFTITPCDLCTFKVRMFSAEGQKMHVPSVDCSENKCILDFSLRAKTRTKYPGACSLFYQEVVQFMYEMIGWDPVRNRRKSVGVFGPVKASGKGDEEQNRGTLHGHTLLWLENFSEVTKMLFSNDEEQRDNAKNQVIRFVDQHFQADYDYDDSIEIFHKECGHRGTISNMFEETSLQDLRDSRNKHLCEELEGKILRCKICHASNKSHDVSCISTVQLNDMVVESYLRSLNESNLERFEFESSDGNSSAQVKYPFSSQRRDILTYMPWNGDDNPNLSPFFRNNKVRHHIANRRQNEHDHRHRRPCFKHGDSCRARLPQMSSDATKFVYDDDDESKSVVWRRLNKSPLDVYPFSVSPKRSIGSEYLNTFHNPTFQILRCNNNIQFGSPKCIFYVVHYATKSTQKEDRGEDFDRIGQQVMRRIRKEQERLSEEEKVAMKNGGTVNEDNYCFREGLSRFLLGMNVHLSQDVVSATMAHLLICQRGTRFTFSHEFKHMLVGQMLNYLNGDSPGNFVLKRRNRSVIDQEPVFWADYSVNDYIYRPACLENISFYEFCIKFDKGYFTFMEMSKTDPNGLPVLQQCKGWHFKVGHPGRQYCYLKESSKEYVPLLSCPKGMICDLEMLELDGDVLGCETEPSSTAVSARENYAKCALVMFYPFRGTELFELSGCDDCLWDKLQRVMSKNNQDEDISFWNEGQFVLQNMQDAAQSRKAKIPSDELETLTENPSGKNTKYESKQASTESDSEWEDADSVGSYEHEEYAYTQFTTEEDDLTLRKLNDLKKGTKMQEGDIINTRLSSSSSVFQPGGDTSNADGEECKTHDSSNYQSSNDTDPSQDFSSLLAFVSGSLAVQKRTSNNEDEEEQRDDSNMYQNFAMDVDDVNVVDDCEWLRIGVTPAILSSSMPTINGVAEKVHKEKGILLDRIQYVAYKIICSSFMLNVINETWDRRMLHMSGMVGSEDINEEEKDIKNKIVDKLKRMGGKVQLLMFITGPAGAGKSTAVEVAQHFCFEFTRAVGQHWDETTFLYTATTGCAASLYGGVTLHSAGFLNQHIDKISEESMKQWDNVKMVVVDEISMAANKTMKKFNGVLNKTRKRRNPASSVITPTMIFGGYSIIFCGDFRQIPPVKVAQSDLLYSNRGMWENAINVAIVLENSHRFNQDPEYGRILMRIWKGELTEEDRAAINSRLVGVRGIKLPEISTNSDIAYSCPKNVQRDLIHTELFQKHIANFPDVTSDDLPPEHTVILEADITQAPKCRSRSVEPNKEDRPKSIKVSRRIRHRIYSRCGDSDMSCNNKHIDPSIKTYVGGHVMINDNTAIKKGLANGTTCRVTEIKRKNPDSPLRWINVDGKKVFAEKVSDTEYMEIEKFPLTLRQKKLLEQISTIKKQQSINCEDAEEYKVEIQKLEKEYDIISKERRFKLYPKEYNCIFDKNLLTVDDITYRRSLSRSRGLPKKNCKVRLLQYPVNLNDATTGHKLQGSSKNMLIVRNWSYTPGWLYTNLSRVRTLNGLYLMQELKPTPKERKTSFIPSRYLLQFDERMRSKIPDELK